MAVREKQRVIHKGIPIRLSAYFSAEILQARKEWHKTFKVMKEKNLPPRMLYPESVSFKIEEEIKSFPYRQKLKEFIITKLTLQEMLKGLL